MKDLMCDVERLDHELHQQIQWKLEACKKAEDLQSKLTEMESVLSWASENVDVAYGPFETPKAWRIYKRGDSTIGDAIDAPTLYQALHQAWVSRDTTKDL